MRAKEDPKCPAQDTSCISFKRCKGEKGNSLLLLLALRIGLLACDSVQRLAHVRPRLQESPSR